MMYVLNPGDSFNGGQNTLPNGKWACFLAFQQTPKSKPKGIIVNCPIAARKFAECLLMYAEEEEKEQALTKKQKPVTKKKKKKA